MSTTIIEAKTAATSEAVPFSIFGDGASARLTGDPTSGDFRIKRQGHPSGTILTLNTSTAADAETYIAPGDYLAEKDITGSSVGLIVSGGINGVQCNNPG